MNSTGVSRRQFLAAGAAGALHAGGLGAVLAQATGAGIAVRDFKSLLDGIGLAKDAPVTLMVEGGIEIPRDLAIPANLRIAFSKAGRLIAADAVTVSINGGIIAGEQQVFDGAGNFRGGVANGAVMCAWFGVVGDDLTDNASALLRMREFLRHSPGAKSITFSEGTFRYTRNEWVKGIRDLEINAKGARFLNVSNRTGYNFEEHPFVGNWGPFNPAGYGLYVGSGRLFGYRIRSCRKGEVALSCIESPPDENVLVGSRVLIYGFGQQAESFPPNPRYFDYNRVAAYDRKTSTLLLEKPLQHDYDSRWHDFARGKGAPRLLPLDRSDYAWGSRLVINGGDFPQNPQHKGNAVQIEGYDSVTLNQVRMYRFVPSFCRDVTVNNCEVDNIESDKLIERLTYHACDIATHYGATGVELLSFSGGTRITRTFETAAKNTVFDGVEFHSAGARSARVCITLHPFYVQKSVVFKSARVIIGKRETEAVLSGGGESTFVVASVLDGKTVLVAAIDDNETQRFTQRLHAGFSYATGAGKKKCTLRNIYRYDIRHLAFEGDFSAAPVAGESYSGGNIDLLRIEKLSQSGAFAPAPLVFRSFVNKTVLPGQ